MVIFSVVGPRGGSDLKECISRDESNVVVLEMFGFDELGPSWSHCAPFGSLESEGHDEGSDDKFSGA